MKIIESTSYARADALCMAANVATVLLRLDYVSAIMEHIRTNVIAKRVSLDEKTGCLHINSEKKMFAHMNSTQISCKTSKSQNRV